MTTVDGLALSFDERVIVEITRQQQHINIAALIVFIATVAHERQGVRELSPEQLHRIYKTLSTAMNAHHPTSDFYRDMLTFSKAVLAEQIRRTDEVYPPA